MTNYRGREIPWLPVVQFHKEVVTRAEEDFFSLNGSDDQAERWTNLPSFSPNDLVGPWQIDREDIRSHPFRRALEQQQPESLFLGGPCYLGWRRSQVGSTWIPQWRPLLYREVDLRSVDNGFEIVPRQGSWSVTPLLYGLFSRLEIHIGESLDEFANRIIDKACDYRTLDPQPLEECILKAFFAEVPDAEEELRKSNQGNRGTSFLSPWVLFAPTTNFSAITRYLMGDYQRLEELLQQDPTNIGGLRLLEDRPHHPTSEDIEVLPLVPLNDSQRRAVKTILEERPLTAISGPPGTGKSQVVVALLLNAWARGRTVLFASNNNKAVDVVRERVERFESEFPIAVRAGAKRSQNIQDVLRRTINMASAATSDSTMGSDLERLHQRRQKLLAELAELEQALDSGLPQRIDEARKTALSAYGEYRSRMARIAERDNELRQEQERLGLGEHTLREIEDIAAEDAQWIDRMGHFQMLMQRDDAQRRDLGARIVDVQRRRNCTIERLEISDTEIDDWKWLSGPASVEQIANWEQRIRDVLETPIERKLEPIKWSQSFDRWESSERATQWAQTARSYVEFLHGACVELPSMLASIRVLNRAVEEERTRLQSLGIPEDFECQTTIVAEWIDYFAEYMTMEKRQFDFLPWSRRAILRRKLRSCERHIRSAFSLEFWMRIGTLDDDGRQRLAPTMGTARRWLDLKAQRRRAQVLIDEIDSRFFEMRSQAVVLGLDNIPIGQDVEAWQHIAAQTTDWAVVADSAAGAWRERAEQESTKVMLRSLAREWLHLANGIPLCDLWRREQGIEFDQALRQLADYQSLEAVGEARTVFRLGRLSHLLECWRTAATYEQQVDSYRAELLQIPHPDDRLESWLAESPRYSFLRTAKSQNWPDRDALLIQLTTIRDWTAGQREHTDVSRPADLQKAQDDLEWAISKLGQAIDVLPAGSVKDHIRQAHCEIEWGRENDWPIDMLNDAFAEYSPDRIRAKVAQIEAGLEAGSFEDAKARWLERLRTDDAAVQAVDSLERSLRQYRGQIVEQHYDTFREALRVVPIWITTAQSSQAIPLEPELFDIVVIDEASQCTLTNLLPLMYRGKALAVIGDDNQLPAIPTIQEAEEIALARKYGIEDYLSLVGHATNDVYKAATESLPRRRADAIMLDEHFRSCPQIIGFSNRYIYLQRLELKRDPSREQSLPIGSGVHMLPVMGVARRGPKGRSWINPPEADRVIALVRDLKEGDARGLSLGVVTPFAAQKDSLRERLDDLRLGAEVWVDTAYGFQGDERDIIVFSPVVAKGITSSASRWVETPPNLINVALTRAREALFVVADFDYCLQQEGMLRQLALYCRDIQLLRESSVAELELFSWMVVKAWEPKVHPRIGDIEVDFVLEADSGDRVVIEVDGDQHARTQERDKARDTYLQGQGYTVLRFRAREVLETPFDVIHRIEQRLSLQGLS